VAKELTSLMKEEIIKGMFKGKNGGYEIGSRNSAIFK